jgi:hypothetical protein
MKCDERNGLPFQSSHYQPEGRTLKNLKIWIGALALFVSLIGFTGCGGGGTTGSGGSGGNITRYAIEALKGGTIIDPTNIVVGETVQFQYVGYTATNQRIVQGSSGWTLDPTGQSEGTITTSGSFNATASGPQFTVSATAGGATVNGVAQVKAAGLALVSGRLVDGYGNFGYGMIVDFYDSGNTLVGSSTAQGNGNFRGAVPTSATKWQVRPNSIPLTYYKEFYYQSKWYLPSAGLECLAPLPSLTGGSTTNLGDIVVPPTSNQGSSLPPPPPPNGCF